MNRRRLAGPRLRVLFRVAVGPRRGFGHLVRAARLARALGVRPAVSVRGQGGAAVAVLGIEPEVGSFERLLQRHPWDVVVVDDPVTSTASAAIARARGAGALTVSIHDLGLGSPEADFQVDGSLGGPYAACAPGRSLVGPRYAIVDPAVVSVRERKRGQLAGTGRSGRADGPRVLIALGGGRRASTAARVAGALAAELPNARVRIAGGFVTSRPGRLAAASTYGTPRRGRLQAARSRTTRAGATTREARYGAPDIRWLPPLPSLARELAGADLVVVAGGVTLYEAAALGVPAIAVAVAESQRPTIEAFARAGLAGDGGRLFGRHVTGASVAGVIESVRRLLNPAGRHCRRKSGDPIDGRGAHHVADAIRRWVREKRRETEGACRAA